ncbi:MAG: hypothetical protein M1840_006656 [Geoglossum simile]|nr:MAG: hypothetical protein M1840_006656 [Geoglossum simile]
MSEMRDAREFWKAFVIAWTLVVVVHLTYGLYVYSQQGQFTYVPAVQGIGHYAPRTAGNIINILIHITSATMYCNVTMKSLYYPIVVDRFKGPLLETRKGHFVWCIMAVVVWIFAFIVASVIPNFGDLVGVVASLFVLQYTYTLPVFFIIAEARLNAQETWFETARKYWIKWIFVFLCLVATVLGTYSSIRAMVLDVREGTTPSAFSCRSPAQPR